MKFISYAQNFEDFMLWRALKQVRCGFYIDVGAGNPVSDSVTKWFYDNSWSGINIEPILKAHENFIRKRPRDVNLNVMASNKEGLGDFYECNMDAFSTSTNKNIEELEKEFKLEYKKTKKNAKTLEAICEENKVSEVNFLKVDVEGSELKVLQGLSFAKVRPWVVLFEAVKPFHQDVDVSQDCVIYLKSKNYHQVYYDGLNKFFVADEHKELDTAFKAPLNIFDYPFMKLNPSHWLLHETVVEKDQIIQNREREIEMMKSSKFWNIREKYISLKNKFKIRE